MTLAEKVKMNQFVGAMKVCELCFVCLLDFFLFRYDPRELDVVLREVVVMNARAEMYLRFLEKRIVVSSSLYHLMLFIVLISLTLFKLHVMQR